MYSFIFLVLDCFRMTRHAKNVTAGNIYTNHERKKDAKESGYGSLSLRLSKDSIQVSLIFNILTDLFK